MRLIKLYTTTFILILLFD